MLTSILGVLSIALILAFILLAPKLINYDGPTAYLPVDDKPAPDPPTKPKTRVNRPASAPSSLSNRVMVSIDSAPTAIPRPILDATQPTVEFGEGDSNGLGIGEGMGDEIGCSPCDRLPRDVSKRCSKQDRMERLSKTGGNVACEDAVYRSLKWLKNTQNEDGSWENQHKSAMTGLALLVFLGRCETPMSAEFGAEVTDGILYLINVSMQNDGKLSSANGHSWVYEHAIATYALAEAYIFCKELGINIPDLEDTLKQAGNRIIDGQGESGGWVYNYEPTSGGDNSVGYWQIQALKACKHTELWEEEELKKTADKALAWLSRAQGANGAIGYRGDSNRSPGLTGGGVLAFQMWEKPNASEVRKGIDYITNNTEFEWGQESSNLYYHYYNAQAMINHGGKKWKWYNDMVRDELLRHQADDGSWTKRLTTALLIHT